MDYKVLTNADAIYLDTSALLKIDKEEGDSSRLVRLLVYGSTIPVYSSSVGLSELIGKMGQKKTQASIGGAIGFLFHCRELLLEFELDKIHKVEPPRERQYFIQIAEKLCTKFSALGGADIWHLLSVVELRRKVPTAILLSYDKDMVKAAKQEAIQTLDGNDLNPDVIVKELIAVHKWIGA